MSDAVSAAADAKLHELVAYLVTCARLALDEPPVYGSFRLAEAVVRLLEAAPELGLTVDDDLRRVRASVDEHKLLMIEQHDAYRAWLDDLAADVAGSLARRNLAPG